MCGPQTRSVRMTHGGLAMEGSKRDTHLSRETGVQFQTGIGVPFGPEYAGRRGFDPLYGLQGLQSLIVLTFRP